MKKILLIVIIIVILITGYSISVTPSYDTLDISAALGKAKATLKDNQEIVVFNSKNPFNFYDVFHRIDKISDQLSSYTEGKGNQDRIEPNLIYYAGIMYYRKKTTSVPHSKIHYLKGYTGVQELVSWWHNSGSNK